jgi:hypothetical protein
MEIFYDYAITPAVRLIPSYQHNWEPLTAQVATKQSEAVRFGLESGRESKWSWIKMVVG